MFAGSPELVAGVGPADLPPSFRVTVRSAPVEALAGRLADVPGVKAVVATGDEAVRLPRPLDRVVRPTA